ncbi:MAG: iron ABC transporter substrate-binding protein [Methanospirillum sp.]|nr:iron ABC transporter substrate-binding protein [Methanospirillum sp.]
MKRTLICIGLILFILLCSGFSSAESQEKTRTVTDSLGRNVVIPEEVDSVICSGAGALRYLTYLQMQDKIIGVDSIDAGEPAGRPYAIAHPEFQDKPMTGDFKGSGHGSDNLEGIISLHPDVIIKTYESPENVEKEEEKLGIPIIYLEYGDVGVYRDQMYKSLRILGEVMGAEKRAEEVIGFFDNQIADLDSRTKDLPDDRKPSAYVGGVGYYGSVGLESTEPAYPPFMLTNVRNVASGMGADHAQVSGEKIIEWDPEYLFVDLGCKDLAELPNTTIYPELSAGKNNRAYGLLPYNSYTTDQDTVLANAYFIGSVLYPDTFSDIDPTAKADEIYSYLVGKPVFDVLNQRYGNRAFSPLHL